MLLFVTVESVPIITCGLSWLNALHRSKPAKNLIYFSPIRPSDRLCIWSNNGWLLRFFIALKNSTKHWSSDFSARDTDARVIAKPYMGGPSSLKGRQEKEKEFILEFEILMVRKFSSNTFDVELQLSVRDPFSISVTSLGCHLLLPYFFPQLTW